MSIHTNLCKDTLHKIVEPYGIKIQKSQELECGYNSSYLLDTAQGRYVLTILEQRTVEDTLETARLLLYLADNDFFTTQPLLSKKYGIVSEHLGRPVVVKQYISGHIYEALERGMLEQVGVEMARLHQIPAPEFLSIQYKYGKHSFGNIIGKNVNIGYESWLAKQLDFFERSIPLELPCGIIHCDLFADNIIFDGQVLKAFIDFEEACYHYRLFDLAMGIVGLCTKGMVLDLNKARYLIKGYQREQPLEIEEKELLQLFVDYAATSNSYWRFWTYNIDRPDPAKANKYLQPTNIAKMVKSIPRKRFMEELFSD